MKKLIFAILLMVSLPELKAQTIWNYYQTGSCIDPYDLCFSTDDGVNVYPIYAYRDTSMFFVYADSINFSGCSHLKLGGLSSEYVKGDGTYATFPTIPTNTSQLTNGAGFLLSSDIAGKLNISDTAAMLSPYLLEGAAAATYATISGLNSKQNQLNGTGFVKVSGTTVSYDNSTYLTSEVDGSITNEIELPSQTGNAGKHLVTNGTSASWAAVKRQETYSGTTNGSGVYTVTFGTSYSVAPNIQVQIVGGTSNQVATCTVSTTGFTVTVVQRNAVTLLGTEVLLASTSNVSGASVDVLISEK